LEKDSVEITSTSFKIKKLRKFLRFDVGIEAVNFGGPHLEIGRSWQLQILVLAVSYKSKQMYKIFYATGEDITHQTSRRWFSNALALWYGLEIYPNHLFHPHHLEF
jgi:hypothetical protein